MASKEAYRLLVTKWPEFEAVTCFEYASMYVFSVIPKGSKEDATKRLDSLCSVNKKDRTVRVIQPFDIPISEYHRGKKVTSFK